MIYQSIRVTVTDGVERITLARPERRNALSDQLVAELHGELRRAEADPDVRVILLDAMGPDFCAGADLEESFRQIETMTPEENLANARRLGDLLVAFRRLDKVVVGAIQGRALAGGAGIATSCDVVIAADDAQLGYPEVHLGLAPAMVGAILRRSVGEKAGFDLVISGERIGAVEAHRLGLVTRVVPADELLARATEYAATLATRSPTALRLIKRLFYGQDGLSFEDGIGRGAEVNIAARGTPEARAGMAAFLARRNRSR